MNKNANSSVCKRKSKSTKKSMYYNLLLASTLHYMDTSIEALFSRQKCVGCCEVSLTQVLQVRGRICEGGRWYVMV